MSNQKQKYCTKCSTTKPITEYWKNKSSKDGLQGWCKPCWQVVTNSKLKGVDREKYLRMRRSGHLKRKYGVTADEYDSMLLKQGGVCAICKNKPDIKHMAVDHNHETGAVRGILCENCNRAIGLLYDNKAYLQSAIDYLS